MISKPTVSSGKASPQLPTIHGPPIMSQSLCKGEKAKSKQLQAAS